MKKFLKNLINKTINRLGYSIINNNQNIVELTEKDKNLINLISNYSMTPKIRIYNLLQALRYLKKKKYLEIMLSVVFGKEGT